MKPSRSRSRRYPTAASSAIRRAMSILTKKRKDLSAKEDNGTSWTKEEIAILFPPSAWDITKRHIISLVEEMERACQYIELKDFLLAQQVLQLYNCVPEELVNDIIAFVQEDDRFEKLDAEDIEHALRGLHLGLICRRHVVNPHPPSDMLTDDDSQLVYLVDDQETFEKNQLRLDDYLAHNPIFRLVYQTLKMNHVLHQEPEEELKILKNELHSTVYYNEFISEEQNYKEKTVTFAYDDCDASQEDIKTMLSDVGEILSVHISSLNMAHVTFRDLTAAKDAICRVAQGQLKLTGRPVTAALTSYNKPTSDSPTPTSQYTTAAMSALEKLEDGLLSDARKRYAMLVEKANGHKMDNKRKRDSVLSGDLESDDMQSG